MSILLWVAPIAEPLGIDDRSCPFFIGIAFRPVGRCFMLGAFNRPNPLTLVSAKSAKRVWLGSINPANVPISISARSDRRGFLHFWHLVGEGFFLNYRIQLGEIFAHRRTIGLTL